MEFLDPPKNSSRSPYVTGFRYRLFHPKTGLPVTWSRVTKFAKTLSDNLMLHRWEERMATKGFALDPSALSLLASLDVGKHKGVFEQCIREAKKRAGADEGAKRGRHMHDLTEYNDTCGLTGERPETPEEKWDIKSYETMLRAHDITTDMRFIERYVAIPRFNLCGKMDRVYSVPISPGSSEFELVIGDIKTARNIQYSWLEIAIQLALYAHAKYYWDDHEDDWLPMPCVSHVRAIVAHLPSSGIRWEPYDLNIVTGIEACQLALNVLAMRSRKDLSAPLGRVPGHFYATHLRAARSREELSALWHEAYSAGHWTAELEQLGLSRLEELREAEGVANLPGSC